MTDFVHLHLHSEYSLLDGACRIKELPAAVRAAGQTAVALTDHGNLFGAVAFYEACKAEDIKPIIGCEVYVAPGERTDKTGYGIGSRKYDHLVLLCENEQGYRNLMTLVSKGYTEGFYSRPRIDLALLREHHEGLIALSGCLAGHLAWAILQDDFAEADRHARMMQEMMGPEHYYIELQDHGCAEDQKVLPELVRLSNATGIPTVATNDVHYLQKKDAETQQLLVCIGTASSMQDGRMKGFEQDAFYLKTGDEMAALFAAVPEAIENTVRIANRCNLEFTFGKLHLPGFPLPEGTTAQKELQRLAEEGLQRRKEAGELDLVSHTEEDYRYRMIYEMMIIAKMGYCDYYLIVRDFVSYAKRMEIPTGPGRGSGAGSLVAYLIGITEIDSIRYNLLFERFLNPERVSMPDFDIDFCYDRRDEVIAYVTEKYGRDHVCQIAAFGTLAARAAVRDVGRALGMSYSDTDRVAALIPRDLGITIRDAIASVDDLRTFYEQDAAVKRLLDLSMAVEGMPRHITTHAAGIVITERPLTDYLPLVTSGDAVLTQFDMLTVEKLGLLKFDFLALRYLTIISETEKLVRKSEPDFSVEKIPLDDPDSFALMSRGDTDGVFQLESAGMKRLLCNMRPHCIEDVMIAIALYRPGPMDSIPAFLQNRSGAGKKKQRPSGVDEILADTAGCIVYQEQVMQIFRKVAGYSYGKADVVRRAMAKKHPEELEKERSTFLIGAKRNLVSVEEANALFDEMAGFASYAFNKSHAAAYSYLSYRTAYLKAHYRGAYAAALLSSVQGVPAKTAQYIADCAKAGIQLLAPDINSSEPGFSVTDDGHIRFGFAGIRNVGDGFAAAILEERKQNGPYRGFTDFLRRLHGKGLNKQALQSLTWAGCFDCFPQKRSQLSESCDFLLSKYSEGARRNIEGQTDLFATVAEPEDDVYPDMPEYPLQLRLQREKEATGLYFSGNPLDGYSKSIEKLCPTPIASVLKAGEAPIGEHNGQVIQNKSNITVCGVATRQLVKKTKKGEEILFLTLEDPTGELEILFFRDTMLECRFLLRESNVLCVSGSVSCKEDEATKLVASHVSLLPADTARDGKPSPTAPSSRTEDPKISASKQPTLYLRLPSMEGPLYRRIEAILTIFEGGTSVVCRSIENGKIYRLYRKVHPSPFVLGELKELLGEENVILKT